MRPVPAVCACGTSFLKDAPTRKKCDECRKLKVQSPRVPKAQVVLTEAQRNYADFLRRLPRSEG